GVGQHKTGYDVALFDDASLPRLPTPGLLERGPNRACPPPWCNAAPGVDRRHPVAITLVHCTCEGTAARSTCHQGVARTDGTFSLAGRSAARVRRPVSLPDRVRRAPRPRAGRSRVRRANAASRNRSRAYVKRAPAASRLTHRTSSTSSPGAALPPITRIAQ